MHSRRRTRVLSSLLVTLLLLVTFLGPLGASTASASPATALTDSHTPANTYSNPARITIPGSTRTVQTFADPAVIKAKDGFYYAYATKDPLFDGDRFRVIPIIRSNDLVHWTYVGDAFPSNPAPATGDAGIFAPDIRYINDMYYLYYSITDTTLNEGGDSAIGVATSPNPAGPFTPRGLVVEPQPNPCCEGSFRATIDPAIFVDEDGQRYIYFGSYFGGLFVRRLSDNGLRSEPASERPIAVDNRYEAPFVVKRGEFYYMFVSATDCCNYELTGYSVFAGRSRSPLGPFMDKQGVSFLDSRVGGTPVISMNGNKWVGPGHNAVMSDLSGQDYFFYHAINRFNPLLTSSNGVVINRRPLLIDRLDYINGWPTVRAGYWASTGAQRAPVTTGVVYDEFNRPAATGIGGSFTRMGGAFRIVNPSSGTNKGYVKQTQCTAPQAMLISDRSTPADYRVEADLRLSAAGSGGTARYGLVTSYLDKNNYVVAYLQPGANGVGGVLVTNIRSNGINSFQRTPLAGSANPFRHKDFHNLAVEVRSSTILFEVTESRLEDPLAVQVRQLPLITEQNPILGAGRVGFATQYACAEFDNLSAARLYTPVTQMRPNDMPGTLSSAFSEEFTDECGRDTDNPDTDRFDARYTFLRQPANSQYDFVTKNGNCYFRFLTQNADLFENSNNAPVLLRDAPNGNFTVETRVQLNLPPDYSNLAFRQAGLVLYENDDEYIKLTHVGIFNTRQTEFAKEQLRPVADGSRYGNTVVGPPAYTTYLRIVRRVNSTTGLQTYTAYTRQEGRPWVRGGTWTHNLQSDALRIGLVAMGGDGRTADFDYVRVYQP